jgi:hypothetical protein
MQGSILKGAAAGLGIEASLTAATTPFDIAKGRHFVKSAKVCRFWLDSRLQDRC